MGKLLDLAKKIEDSDVIKGVLPKGADGLKKLRDLEEQVSGAAGMGADAMQSMMKQATSVLGSAQSVLSTFSSLLSQTSSKSPTIPTGSYATTHETASATANIALTQLVEELNTMTMVQSICDTIESTINPISAFTDHEEFIRRMDILTKQFQTLEALDISYLGASEINILFDRMNALLLTANQLNVSYFMHYNNHDIITAYPLVIAALSFQGIDKSLINQSATALIKTMKAIAATPNIRYGQFFENQLSHAADILTEMLNRIWTLSATEQCIKDAVDAFYPTLNGMIISKTLTLDNLTSLLQKLIDAISNCSAAKALDGNAGGSSGSIPQIGGMIDKTMSDFIQKGINDIGKVQEALKKFTKKQSILEKKRQMIDDTVAGGNSSESPAASSSSVSNPGADTFARNGGVW